MFTNTQRKCLFLTLCSESTCKRQTITNEGGRGVTKNLLITKRSGRFPTQTSTFVRSSCGESTSCEHVSTTYGAKPVQGFWRSQERKDISRGSGCAWISKRKLHDTHVSLISDLFKEHIHLHESSTASSVFFKLGTHCKSKTRDRRAGVLRMRRTNAVSSVFLCLLAKPQPRAWTWDNEAHSGANDMALCSLFFFTYSIPGCVRNMFTQSTCSDAEFRG